MKKITGKRFIFILLALIICGDANSQYHSGSTYCNPLNLDYTYMIYNAHNNISYRSGADPAVVEFRGEYYMFPVILPDQ